MFGKKKNKRSFSSFSRSDRIVNEKSPFVLKEAYRNVRANLYFTIPGKSTKKVIVTSAISGEGKSTTIANLAVSMAMTESKVLLIDCDLRKPRLNRFFKIKNETGLSNFLCGDVEDAKSVIKKTSYENLDVIVAGRIPPNPAELLGSDEFKVLLDSVSEDYDYILADTPPLETVSDTLLLVPYFDGVVLVVKYDLTMHPILQRTIRKLEFANAKIAGLVLNGFDEKKNNKYYRYGYKYKYYQYSQYTNYADKPSETAEGEKEVSSSLENGEEK